MQRGDRQNQIISAVFSLISEQGIQELTIKKIAEAVGVSEPAIYRHFSSKADILSSVIDEMIAQRNATFTQVRAGSSEARDMIRSFFSIQASLFEMRPELSIMLFPEEIFRNNDELLATSTSMMKDTLVRFGTLLQAGIAEGSLLTTLDCEAVALMLVGGFRLLVSSWRMDDRTDGLQEDTRRFIEGVFSIIRR